jgi:hypothetical protein
MRNRNHMMLLGLTGVLVLPSCSADAATQAETDKQLLGRYAAAELQVRRSAAAGRLLATIRDSRRRARSHRESAAERLRRPARGLGAFMGNRGNFGAAQAEKRMAQTLESRARKAEQDLATLIAKEVRTSFGDNAFARALELRRVSAAGPGKR